MGGHGGLNILPQKRWNVYNRDNRLKVAQDEAKARQEQQEAEERHQQAEREFRMQQMLAKARGTSMHDEEPAPKPAAQGPAAEPAAQPVLEHINFWKDLEVKAQHPEVEAAKREEARKRGKADMQTSDAKFDERFQLAHGLTGKTPWYAQAPSKQQQHAVLDTQPSAQRIEGEPASKKRKLALPEGCAKERPKQQQQQQQPSRKELKAQLLAELKQLDAVLGKNSSSPSDASDGSIISSDSKSDTSTTSSSDSGSSGSSSSSGTSSSDKHNSQGDLGRTREGHGSKRSSSKHKMKHRSRDGKHRSKHRSKSKRKSRSRSPSTHRSSSKKSSSKKSRKSKEKERRKDRSRHSRKGRDEKPAAKGASIEQLRQERLKRELQERERGRLVLSGALAADADGRALQNGRKYHSGYGFVPPSKRQRASG